MKTRDVLRKLYAARDAAQMKRASFGNIHTGDHEAYTAQVIEDTRSYRESWIIGPINDAIAEIEASIKKR